eukprot:6927669-Prymnesium_polylepis.1
MSRTECARQGAEAIGANTPASGGTPSVSHQKDLQSEAPYHQMQRSYEGVKSSKCCEAVTVGRRAARDGESRCH